MNPLRETFHLLYANRLKQKDLLPVFSALSGTIIFAYLNLLVVTMLSDPFTGYFSWLGNHGWQTLLVVSVVGVSIGLVQYFCWIANGKLERERVRIERGPSPKRILVFTYIALSILALPATGILMHHLKTT
jgi:uncharacterized membrane protein